MITQIFIVDFQSKRVMDKYIGKKKVEYYRCICCTNKYAKSPEDSKFMPFVGWEFEQSNRTIPYNLCKGCIEKMYNLVKED